MSKSIRFLALMLIFSALVLSACAASNADAPAVAIQAYWQAMAAKDSTSISSLTCAAYEATALTNLNSFQSVELTLKDLNCVTTSSTDSSAEVNCSGSLVASYGAEDTDFDLTNSTYLLTNEAGNWLMCGEK